MIPDFPIDIRIRLAELKKKCCFLTLLILCPVGCLSKTERANWAEKQQSQEATIFFFNSANLGFIVSDLIYISIHQINCSGSIRTYQCFQWMKNYFWLAILKEKSIRIFISSTLKVLYACQSRSIYFLPTFGGPKTFFQGAFFLKFWPYVWLVFKRGF